MTAPTKSEINAAIATLQALADAIPDPTEEAPRVLGVARVPEVGDTYYMPAILNFDGCVIRNWTGDGQDLNALERYMVFRTPEEAAQAMSRAALIERALAIRGEIWESDGKPDGVGEGSGYHPMMYASSVDATDWAGLPGPWRFRTEEGCKRFIEAIGPDLRRLLTLDATDAGSGGAS